MRMHTEGGHGRNVGWAEGMQHKEWVGHLSREGTEAVNDEHFASSEWIHFARRLLGHNFSHRACGRRGR